MHVRWTEEKLRMRSLLCAEQYENRLTIKPSYHSIIWSFVNSVFSWRKSRSALDNFFLEDIQPIIVLIKYFCQWEWKIKMQTHHVTSEVERRVWSSSHTYWIADRTERLCLEGSLFLSVNIADDDEEGKKKKREKLPKQYGIAGEERRRGRGRRGEIFLWHARIAEIPNWINEIDVYILLLVPRTSCVEIIRLSFFRMDQSNEWSRKYENVPLLPPSLSTMNRRWRADQSDD